MENNEDKTLATYKIWIPLLISLACLIGLFAGYRMAGKDVVGSLIVKTDSDAGFNSGRVEELVRFIESRYVDDLNSEELIEDAFKNVLDHLDPHSIYLRPEEMKQLNDQMGGSFEGIGIESIFLNDTLYVNHIIENGPAFMAGLQRGDQILSVNDTLIAGRSLSYDQIRNTLKGDKDLKLNLQVRDFETKDVRNLDLNIGNVDVKSVQGFIYENDYAVVRIDRFSSDSYKEFMDCLNRLNEQGGFKHLVLDLRGNPGGFLPEATKMLNQIFKEKGRLMVYTQGRNERVSEYKSTGKNFYDIDKVAILVDEGSASGSEIIAGAIQDWDRGLIVGRRTFGKGLVQEQYNLNNGGAIRLTVAEYFTPSGRLIQKSFEDRKTYRDDIASRIQSGELTGSTDVPIMDTTVFVTKVEKRPVYAAGGITPDIYIPIDSLELSSELAKAVMEVEAFIFKKFLKKELEVPENADEFVGQWSASTELLNEFRATLEVSGNQYDWIDQYLEVILKEEVAKLYFDKNTALRVRFEDDVFLTQSVLALSKKNIFAELK
ncbi:S41 family peptidase [Portibacter marinus]|uniref:S41 family peptidase n=1 Tax=Portibacter marinus TaxID=2898660 RepID=UPI001F440CDC|nr:S41 family peptidase [Portibacter marinus]